MTFAVRLRLKNSRNVHLDGLLTQAAALFGGSDFRLSRRCDACQSAIWSARRAGRVSAEMAVKIEKATDNVVPRWKLRPDLWDEPVAQSTVAA